MNTSVLPSAFDAGAHGGDVAAAGATTAIAYRRRGPSALEPWFWGLCLFLLTSPFAYQLTGIDPSAETQRDISTMRRTEGSGALLYALRYLVALTAAIPVLPYWKLALGRLSRMAPILAFTVWAALSLTWTDTLSSSVNGLLALLPLLFTGYCLALRLPPNLFARSFVYSGAFMAGFSLLYVLLLPHFGVHQQSDAAQSVHAGAWRGVYPHKNLLGGLSGAYAVLALLAGPSVLPSRLLRIGLFLTMMLLIVKSSSATALIIVVLAPALVWALVRLSAIQRLLAITAAIPIGIAIAAELENILGLFGRDLTFTGRTHIWELAPDAIAQRPLIGYGYASTTYGDFMRKIFERFGLFDPHNGYLSLLLGTGLVGFGLFFLSLLTALGLLRRLYMGGPGTREAGLVMGGVIAAWLVASFSESQDKPLGAFAAILFSAMGVLVYRGIAPARSAGARDGSNAMPAQAPAYLQFWNPSRRRVRTPAITPRAGGA